jgi:enoyl-CoA hydratase
LTDSARACQSRCVSVSVEIRDSVAVVSWDDGKANALGFEALDALHAALDRAEKDAGAVLLVGRPGRFSAGFDLKQLGAGGDSIRKLVDGGARLLVRLYLHPQPVVVACTGHALAAGALIVMVGDTRIGARGDFKIGLNEVAIGMIVPEFLVELARDRLSKRHFNDAVVKARLYDAEGAVDAGFLDEACDPDALFDRGLAEAQRLAQLPAPAYAGSKRAVRQATVDRIEAGLDAKMAAFGASG